MKFKIVDGAGLHEIIEVPLRPHATSTHRAYYSDHRPQGFLLQEGRADNSFTTTSMHTPLACPPNIPPTHARTQGGDAHKAEHYDGVVVKLDESNFQGTHFQFSCQHHRAPSTAPISYACPPKVHIRIPNPNSKPPTPYQNS